MPTHTPSPHRFLAPSTTVPQKPRQKPPASNLRNGFTANTSIAKGYNQGGIRANTRADEPEPSKPTPAKRFIFAPVHTTAGSGPSLPKPRDRERIDDGGSDTHVCKTLHTHIISTPRPQPRRQLHKVESINESSQESPPATSDPISHTSDITPSIGQSHALTSHNSNIHENSGIHSDVVADAGEDGDTEMLFTSSPQPHKRRRISPRPPSSPAPQIALPQTPVLARPSSHRFLAPLQRTPFPTASPTTTITAITTPASTTSRPYFIVPRHSPSPRKLAAATPLPETFSPSRKGQKYVQGGMASTLQSWIIETASTGYAAQTASRESVAWGKARDREDGVKIKIRVLKVGGAHSAEAGEETQCFPSGVVFVMGVVEAGSLRIFDESSSDNTVRVLLAGQGGVRVVGGLSIRKGDVIGIRSPVWEVKTGETRSVVGVEWLVL